MIELLSLSGVLLAMKDITLANGTVVTHTLNAAGPLDASKADGTEMTNDEWNEYCDLVHAEHTREVKAAKAARKAKSLAAFNARRR